MYLILYHLGGKKTKKLYPSAPILVDEDFKKSLEKTQSNVNSFDNSIIIIREKIRYFKDENKKSKKNHKFKRF